MFIHLLEQQLSKYIERLELELAHMGEADRTRHSENRQHLKTERDLIKRLAAVVEEWNLSQTSAMNGGGAMNAWENLDAATLRPSDWDFDQMIVEPPRCPVTEVEGRP